MNWQNAATVAIFGVAQLVALFRAYYGLKADNAALSSELKMAIADERASRLAEHGTLKEQVMERVARVEASIHDLTHRVKDLETGQDDWTKTLRARTHELSNQVNTLVLKVDRLERPASGEHA